MYHHLIKIISLQTLTDMKPMMKKILIASAFVSLFASQAILANNDTEELRKVIAQQQKVLKKLRRTFRRNRATL